MTQLNPNWIQALTYSARLDRQVVKASFSEGVLSGMKVVQRAAGANMSVDISVGVGVIYGDDQADQGAYLASCTVLENLAITAAPGSNSRRDLIYWRVNDPNAGGPAGSNTAFGKVDGTPGASPALPTLPTSAIPLAEILVTAGDVSILNAKITSLRVPATPTGMILPGSPFVFFGPEASVPADCVLYRGQAISRDTYWRIFYFLGTVYGTGDGSTTFNVPDMRGRSPFGLDNMGGSDAGILSVANTLGGTGGEELHVLTTAELATHTHSTTVGTESVGHVHSGNTGDDTPDHTHTPGVVGGSFLVSDGGANNIGSGTASRISNLPSTTSGASPYHHHPFTTGGQSVNHNHVVTVGNTGSASAHNNMPPYILCNWIARN